VPALQQLNKCKGKATEYTSEFIASLRGDREIYCVQEGKCAAHAAVVRCSWDGVHEWPGTQSSVDCC